MGGAEVLQFLRTPEGIRAVKICIGIVAGVLVTISSVLIGNAQLGSNAYIVIKSVWYVLFGVLMVAVEWPTEHPVLGKCSPDRRTSRFCALETSAFGRAILFSFVGTTVPQPDNRLSWIAGGFAVAVATAELALALTGKTLQRKAAPTAAWPPNNPADQFDASAVDSDDANGTPTWAKSGNPNDMVAIPAASGGAGLTSSTAAQKKPAPPTVAKPAAAPSAPWPPPGEDGDVEKPAVWPPPEDGV